MKMLEPTITCLVMSHMKSTLRAALRSLTDQTRSHDLQVVIIDSGAWFDTDGEVSNEMLAIYKEFKDIPIFEWYFTGEASNLREKVCPVSHWTNLAIREGLLRGKFLCTFYDDDLYYPTFIEKMAGYLDEHPEAQIVRCSEARTFIKPDGTTGSTPSLMADREIPGGENLDCVVDGMQVMFRRELLDKIEGPWLPEDPDISSCSHSDGIFFNKVSKVIDKMHFIPEVLCEHRSTQYSTYTPTI